MTALEETATGELFFGSFMRQLADVDDDGYALSLSILIRDTWAGDNSQHL
jgi:hypothetical protein